MRDFTASEIQKAQAVADALHVFFKDALDRAANKAEAMLALDGDEPGAERFLSDDEQARPTLIRLHLLRQLLRLRKVKVAGYEMSIAVNRRRNLCVSFWLGETELRMLKQPKKGKLRKGSQAMLEFVIQDKYLERHPELPLEFSDEVSCSSSAPNILVSWGLEGTQIGSVEFSVPRGLDASQDVVAIILQAMTLDEEIEQIASGMNADSTEDEAQLVDDGVEASATDAVDPRETEKPVGKSSDPSDELRNIAEASAKDADTTDEDVLPKDVGRSVTPDEDPNVGP